MRVSKEMQSAWSEYWKDGPTDSMPEDRAAGRLGALDSAWREFFAGLPDKARLLDLATGGGDVIRQAVAQARDFAITGVDIADLSAIEAAMPGIELIGNTDLSSLPFADGAFDGVASQFGFEYADIASAAREAIRVLAPGGRGHFVMHHAESAVTRGARASLAAYRSVFAGSNAFERGRAVFEQHRQPEQDSAAAEASFRSAVRMLQSRVRDERPFAHARNVVGFLTRLSNSPAALPAAEGLHRLGVVEKHNEALSLRKLAQIDAARDARGVETIRQFLTGAGAVVGAPQELKYPGGNLLGWSLSFARPASP